MPADRRCRTTPLIRASRAIASKRSPSSLMLSRGRDTKRCHSGGGGSGSAAGSLRARRGRSPAAYRSSGGCSRQATTGTATDTGAPSPSQAKFTGYLNDLRNLQALVYLAAQARRAVLLPDVVVIRNPGEEVVRPRRDRGAIRPLLSLQIHVTLFFVVLQAFEEDRHPMAGSVLQRERDEDEADAQQAQLVPGDRVLLVEPLERGRVVESKPRLGEALAD